jgi:hypothetical protein
MAGDVAGNKSDAIRAAFHEGIDAVAVELAAAISPRLQLGEPLGAGGMGFVFLARDPALKRSVAIKVLSPRLAADDVSRQRFAREAQAAAALAHPNVISVFEVGELPKSHTPYFVMQFVEGDTLEKVVADGPMSQVALRRLLTEASSALAAAHERGLIHRDIKPANIMLERGSGRAIVLDFGISAAATPNEPQATANLTATGTYIGTPSHMAPEQALGLGATDRSDIYSLGLVAFEAATGKPVFDWPTPMAMLAAHIHQAPPLLGALRPDVDAAMAGLIDRCLAKQPADRPSAQEISRQFASQHQAVIEWPPPGLETIREKGQRMLAALHRAALMLLALLLVAYLQPVMSTPAWRTGEDSALWRALRAPYEAVSRVFVDPMECRMRAEAFNETCRAAQYDASPLWFSLVAVMAWAILVCVIVLWHKTDVFVREARAMRRVGYPADIISAVAIDRDADTGALLNGLGEFASLDGHARREKLGLRKRAALLEIAASALAFVIPVAGLPFVRTDGSRGDVYLLGTPEIIVAMAPLLLYALAQFIRFRERRWLRSARRGHLKPSAAPVRTDVVRAWLAGSAGKMLPTGPARLVLFVPLLALFGHFVAVGVVAMAGYQSIWLGTVLRGWVSAWHEGRPAIHAASRDHPIRWQHVDSVLAALQPLTPVTLSRDTTEDAKLVLRPGTDKEWPSSEMWDSLPVRRSAKGMARMASDTSYVPLYRLRRTAARLAAGERDTTRIEPDLLHGNISAAYLALVSGDTVTALRRLGEILRVGRQEWAVDAAKPGGGAYNLKLTAAGIAAVQRLKGNHPAAKLAADAQQLTDDWLFSNAITYFGYMRLVAVNPNDTSVLAEIRNPQNGAVRLELLGGLVDGSCTSSREIVFGVSPARRALLERGIAAAKDLAQADQRAKQLRARLDSLERTGGFFGAAERNRICN